MINEDGKIFWEIEKLYNWEKNPRAIRKEDFENLKKKITKWGQFKPIVITKDGEVLGGNMRFRAYKELGVKKVWVSIVEPKDEADKVSISLADNESAGYYVEQDLAELIEGLNIDYAEFKVSLDEGKTLEEVMSLFKPDDYAPPIQEQEQSPEILIEIRTKNSTYIQIKNVLDDWKNKYGIEYNVS